MSNFPQKLLSLTADPGQYPTEPILTVKEDALVKNEEKGTSVSVKNKEQRIENEVDVIILRRIGGRDEYVEFASRHDDVCRNFNGNKVSTLAKERKVTSLTVTVLQGTK